MRGMAERVAREVSAFAPSHMKVHVVAPPDRQYSAWLGGATVASLSSMLGMFISKAEYDEVGPAIVHRKCLG